MLLLLVLCMEVPNQIFALCVSFGGAVKIATLYATYPRKPQHSLAQLVSPSIQKKHCLICVPPDGPS